MNEITETKITYYVYNESSLLTGRVAWSGSIEDANQAERNGKFNDFNYFFDGTIEETRLFAQAEIERSQSVKGRFNVYLFNAATNVLADL